MSCDQSGLLQGDPNAVHHYTICCCVLWCHGTFNFYLKNNKIKQKIFDLHAVKLKIFSHPFKLFDLFPFRHAALYSSWRLIANCDKRNANHAHLLTQQELNLSSRTVKGNLTIKDVTKIWIKCVKRTCMDNIQYLDFKRDTVDRDLFCKKAQDLFIFLTGLCHIIPFIV